MSEPPMPENEGTPPTSSDGGRRDEHHFYNDLSRLNNELATAQRELAKKNAELDRLNREKNQFLGIAAHDLRNPLEVILNYSRFLLEDAGEGGGGAAAAAGVNRLSAEQTEFIRIILSSSRFMLNIVTDFLDYSKIEAGKLELDLEPVDLPRLVGENVRRNRVLAERKGIRIVLETGETPPPGRLFLDRSKVEQVLNNLVGNAVKFSPAGGIIYVSVLAREAEILISVRDSGEGVSPEEAERLFAPFEKGKSGGGRGPAGEKSGAGLGLAIAKKIVEGHGGKITVESEAGRGANFQVAFPLRTA